MPRLPRTLAAGLAVVLVAAPAAAQSDATADRIAASQVVFEPLSGARLGIDDRIHAGTMAVTAHQAGLAVVEETTVDDYLLGIREVPFSWPAEALAAQVVAARTYLAWTLARGRTTTARSFDYDICATTACQVYSGVGGLDGPEGRRWIEAVRRTTGEVLVAGGAPIQAMYSSTSDGRTRNVEDVYLGSAPNPHLRAVESPGETSPFVEWEFTLTNRQAEAMFTHAELVAGRLVDVHSRQTSDGEGPWTVVVTSSDGERVIDTWTLRSRLNRAASQLYPDVFPAARPGSDRRYPQTIMSPNYTIESELHLARPSDGPLGLETRFRVRGGGWGHLVGMSQYGAAAMAESGAGHADILAHFYGGVRPTVAAVLPERIRVGLGTEARELVVTPDGPMRVIVDGEEVSGGELGSWTVAWERGAALLDPPDGLGLSPRVDGWRTFFDSTGEVELVTVRSRTAAELRVVITSGQVVVSDTGWEVREAGVIAVDLESVRPASVTTVEVFARSPLGADSSRLRILGGAE